MKSHPVFPVTHLETGIADEKPAICSKRPRQSHWAVQTTQELRLADEVGAKFHNRELSVNLNKPAYLASQTSRHKLSALDGAGIFSG